MTSRKFNKDILMASSKEDSLPRGQLPLGDASISVFKFGRKAQETVEYYSLDSIRPILQRLFLRSRCLVHFRQPQFLCCFLVSTVVILSVFERTRSSLNESSCWC